MSTDKKWSPPKKIEEVFQRVKPNRFSAINSPVAGARKSENLKVGTADFQLYSLATPNGQKAGIILEELGIDYDAHTINIGKGEQFTSGFVAVNPNSKIPCATDKLPNGRVIRLFESGSILIYLADKYRRFIPSIDHAEKRAECLNWVMWAQVQAMVTGNYGHFFVYAPDDEQEARNYGVTRYGMELQRLCSVLDQHLKGKEFMLGDEYTIADMAIFPWVQLIRTVGYIHDTGVKTVDFLSVENYTNLNRWADSLKSRTQVQRGMLVCRKNDFPKAWLDPSETRFSHLANEKERRTSKL